MTEQPDPTAAIEVWARMLCAADVHVHGEDRPTWRQLVGEPGRQIRDDYRKAAAWLLPRLTVSAAVPPPADRAADEIAKHVARAIFALKAPSPDGSKHYQSGWDDGLEAAMDAARDAVLAVLPASADRASVLREAADAIEEAQRLRDDMVNGHLGFLDNNTEQQHKAVHRSGALLRRMAAEATQVATSPKPANETTPVIAAQRAAVLREAADELTTFNDVFDANCHCGDCESCISRRNADVLRRLAAEARGNKQQDDGLPFVRRVLELFSLSHADAYGDLFWRVDDGEVRLYANVSDVFAWGGADCEPITPDVLPALEQAYADLKAIGAEEFTAELYTARQRGVRPQGAAYPSDAHDAWRKVSALYDACGPERELGLGNPKAAPAHKAAAVVRAAEPADTEALAAVFEGFGRLLATSSRDWGQYAPDAWLYAVILGWDCEETVHDETCTHDAMEEMAARHGWDAATVAKARRYRAAVRALTEPAAEARQDGAQNRG